MFKLDLLLITSSYDDMFIKKQMNCKQKVYNILLKHIIKQLESLKLDKHYQSLLNQLKDLNSKKGIKLSDKKKQKALINKELSDIRTSYGLDKSNIQKYAKVQAYQYKKYLSSQMIQSICDDIRSSLDKYLFGNGKKLHFKKYGTITTLHAKSLTNGIKILQSYDGNHGDLFYIDNMKHSIPVVVKYYDTYAQKCLSNKNNKIKFCSIISKPFNDKDHFYLQLTIDGVPPLKHCKGSGKIGIDVGVSSAAMVSDDNCYLEDLAPNIKDYNSKIKKVQRKLEHIKRVNNPSYFKDDGTYIKGTKITRTKHYKKELQKLKTLYRKKKTYMKDCHNYIANLIIKDSNTIYYEPNSYIAFQKRKKELERQNKVSIITKTKQGEEIKTEVYKYKKKKRFGSTLNNKAPSSFVSILKQKCEFYDIEFYEIDTIKYRASQYNHQTDEYVKKQLNERWNTLTYQSKEIQIQRDLYSAYLIQNSNDKLEQPETQNCIDKFSNFVNNHNKCIEEMKQNNKPKTRLSCFGF